jgi:hypothetical protein
LEAEAAEAAAAGFIANLAAEREAAEAAEAAAAAALTAAKALAEAGAAATAATATGAGTIEGAATTATAPTAQQETPAATKLPGTAETDPQATTATQARAAEAALKAPMAEKGHGPTMIQLARAAQLPLDADDWELSEEGLPVGSTLSGSKALLENYPEDEVNSKKPKKQNNSKGKTTKPKA